MKEQELHKVTQQLNDLFGDLKNGKVTEEGYKELSDALYRKQTRLRYELEHEKGLHYKALKAVK
ncbi:hypothetical protein ACQKGA_27630 [Priestia megaterium]|uniref:hypothetical protein n=1 Tax=Priestia TaxID=2800373 RepID=UPI000B50CC34|nr:MULTISPECIES: hypothetical protein [Priestia]OVE34687.1 hypothetical protein CCZ20_25285 [Priestia aryabhattai]PAK44569.1 hypothetical protein CHH47_26895 [Priestia megaterium]